MLSKAHIDLAQHLEAWLATLRSHLAQRLQELQPEPKLRGQEASVRHSGRRSDIQEVAEPGAPQAASS